MKWKGEAPGMCCSSGKVQLASLQDPPLLLKSLLLGDSEKSRHFLANIRKYNSAFQMTSMGCSLSVCPSVKAFLKNGESDLSRICLAHAQFIGVESETVVVFLTSPTTTPFPADRTRFRSRANISRTAHRISTEFRLLVPDVGR